jgi:hypothetical protein
MRPPRGLPPSVTWVKSVNLYCTYNLMKMSLRKCNRKSLTTPTAPTGWTALSPFNPRQSGPEIAAQPTDNASVCGHPSPGNNRSFRSMSHACRVINGGKQARHIFAIGGNR